MKILGDSQILLFDELFSSLGHVDTYTGREVSVAQLEGVDALVTRSTLEVGEPLLAGSNVGFVGTCTIGVDHFDTDYLNQQEVYWTNAAGCNAEAVVQYVLSAIAQLAPRWLEESLSLGIIGCGNIGGRVYRRLKALGVHCRVYDPLLAVDRCPDLSSLEQVLGCDIITSHAPLTTTGSHPSYHLLGEKELAQLRPGSLLISAGRGGVIDNQALFDKLSQHKDICVALDVWENEPHIMAELIPLVDIATPHIAGHSIQGKEKGTVMIYQALCDYLGVSPPLDALTVMNNEKATLTLAPSAQPITPWQQFNQLLLAAYPIMQDDQRLRDWCSEMGSDKEQAVSLAEHFDALCKHYPIRREYSHCEFPSCAQHPPISDWLNALRERHA